MDSLKKKRDLKAERKRIQDENVKRKQEEKELKTGKKGVKFEEGEGNENNEEG